jgi:hypothetical protein
MGGGIKRFGAHDRAGVGRGAAGKAGNTEWHAVKVAAKYSWNVHANASKNVNTGAKLDANIAANINANMSIIQIKIRMRIWINYGLLLRLTKGLRTAITSRTKPD